MKIPSAQLPSFTKPSGLQKTVSARSSNSKLPSLTFLLKAVLIQIILAIRADSNSIPTGMVAFFNSEECPEGWIKSEDYTGRVLIGRGTYEGVAQDGRVETRQFNFRDEDGEINHKIVEAEMPRHFHPNGITALYNECGGGDEIRGTSWGDGPFKIFHNANTCPVGGDQPHSNMQPFIALTACEKNADTSSEVVISDDSCDTVGAISLYPFEEVPKYHINCDGSSLSQADYPDLYAAIGLRYTPLPALPGTFNVPDYRGLFFRFTDQGAGIDPDAGSRTCRADGDCGDIVGTQQYDQNKAHTHRQIKGQLIIQNMEFSNVPHTGFYTPALGPSVFVDNAQTTESSGGSESHPKNIYINAAIRYGCSSTVLKVAQVTTNQADIARLTDEITTQSQLIATQKTTINQQQDQIDVLSSKLVQVTTAANNAKKVALSTASEVDTLKKKLLK